jgi:glycosyltransferase involved in cell wall biosynthesis
MLHRLPQATSEAEPDMVDENANTHTTPIFLVGADPKTPAAGSSQLDLSIIIPAYNEEDSVRPLYDAIMAAVPPLGLAFEVIIIDDGSTDDTFARCAAIAERDPRVRVIKLRRNAGQTPAMVAGIDHAEGRILITMDADLQNDPADIPLLLREIERGHNVVVGWRQKRQDKFLSRKLPSMIANWIIARATGIDVKDNGCTLKAFRAELIRNVPLYSEMHRFIPAMASISGARVAQVKVRHHPRRFGQSKYGISRIYKVCLDLIAIRMLIAFSRRPMFSFMTGAAAFGALALLCSAVAFWEALSPAYESTVVSMGLAFLFGSLALFLALAGFISSLVHQTLTSDG